MCASDRTSSSGPARGFSLVELIVALFFMSVLMAGMMRVFAGSLSNFVNVTETLGIQRNARWGLAQLQDEVLQAGYIMPPHIISELGATPTSQPPLYMAPTGYTPPGTAAPVQELQMVMDLPLGIQGTLSAQTTGGNTSLDVDIPSGGGLIQSGDYIFIQDSNWEVVRAAGAASGGKISLLTTKVSTIFGDDQGSPVHPTIENLHFVNAPFTVVRPLQVVRYTVVPRPLDPSSDSTQPSTWVPCLVRQTRPLAGNATALWSPAANTPTTSTANGETETVLLENVTDFAIQWSLDGGTTWINPTGKTWSTIQGEVNAAIAAHPSAFVRQAKNVYNSDDPFWMNYVPLIIRIDLETRSRLQRSEFSATSTADAPQAAFRTRRQTLMLSPRNFSLGRP